MGIRRIRVLVENLHRIYPHGRRNRLSFGALRGNKFKNCQKLCEHTNFDTFLVSNFDFLVVLVVLLSFFSIFVFSDPRHLCRRKRQNRKKRQKHHQHYQKNRNSTPKTCHKSSVSSKMSKINSFYPHI